MRAVLLVALVPALALPPSGCGGAGDGTCNQDFDCASAEVCANNHACRDADRVYAVTVAWTLSGQPASADTCALIDHLELEVGESFGADYAHFAPVPCDPGRFPFSKLPDTYDYARLDVVTGGQSLIESHRGTIGPSTGTLTFDLDSAAPLPDAAIVIDAPASIDGGAIVDAGVGD